MSDATDTQRITQLEAQIERLQTWLGDEDTPDAPHADAHAFAEALQQNYEIALLLEDPTINDILINGHDRVYVERAGKLQHAPIRLGDEGKLFALAEAIAASAGRSMQRHRPILDTRLPDGSRVNIIAPPLSVDGTAISIRKFSKQAITLDDMAAQHNISPSLAEFLKVAAKCRLNMVISGGTGSGKTTLLNAISQHISAEERVITIEDAAELRLQQPHIVRLETKPALSLRHTADEVSIRDLVRNALRMRPDRIVVGECRGPEAFDMMQAMNTGHEGSLTTVHANHPRDAIARLENMVTMANLNLPTMAIRQQIASAIHLIIQISRQRDGHRRITYVSEIVGMEGETMTMQDLFVFQDKGDDASGAVLGDFRWSGIMPRFLRRVAYYGETARLSQALGVKLPG
jgi:pilus assembly protein CpaF